MKYLYFGGYEDNRLISLIDSQSESNEDSWRNDALLNG